MDVGSQPFVVKHLEDPVSRVPSAAAEEGQGLPRLDLLAVVAVGNLSVLLLLLSEDVQLAEDLLERLHSLGLKTLPLPVLPCIGFQQVMRMGQAKNFLRLNGL